MQYYDEDRIKAIYAGYKHRVELQHTVRSGFARCGIYPQMERYPDDRPESVSEHIGSISVLVVELSVHLPGLMPASKLGRALRLALFHDAAESVIGDIADNGARNELDKNQREYDALAGVILASWPGRERKMLLRDFRDFQNKSTPLAQLIFVLDKTECAMRALRYEAADCNGSVFNDPNVTELDKFYAAEVGSGTIADTWGYHALDRIAGLDRAYFELGYALLSVAFADTRGEVPEWLPKRYRELTRKD